MEPHVHTVICATYAPPIELTEEYSSYAHKDRQESN